MCIIKNQELILRPLIPIQSLRGHVSLPKKVNLIDDFFLQQREPSFHYLRSVYLSTYISIYLSICSTLVRAKAVDSYWYCVIVSLPFSLTTSPIPSDHIHWTPGTAVSFQFLEQTVLLLASRPLCMFFFSSVLLSPSWNDQILSHALCLSFWKMEN